MADTLVRADSQRRRSRRPGLIAAPWSRRVAGGAAGGVYFVGVLTLDPWVAVGVSFMATALLLARFAARRGRTPATGSGWTELAFAGAATSSLAIGWGLAGDRWIAFASLAFVAWGDNSAGIVRSGLESRLARRWSSLAMFAVCLSACAFVQPYWVGALGAVAATGVERVRPVAHPAWEDNWTITVASLSAMLIAADAV